jgi:4,5-DOPA dioxygenase extradiol
MPSLYLGHGAPPLLEEPDWMAEFAAWTAGLPRPKAILIVSAHWESAPVTVGATTPVPLVYDFYGFPAHYYAMRYDAPPAPDVAQKVASLMPDNEPLMQMPNRGLDHGAWVPLTAMYPDADIPVLQMSMPDLDPQHLFVLGRRLAPLRDEGVLVIGSGFMTHGLPYLTRDMVVENKVPAWSADFDQWAADALARGDVEQLCSYRSAAPGMPYAHPTVDHYIPLFVTLGAATDPSAPVRTAIDGYMLGLSKRSFDVA